LSYSHISLSLPISSLFTFFGANAFYMLSAQKKILADQQKDEHFLARL